jgi:hypothetical protein
VRSGRNRVGKCPRVGRRRRRAGRGAARNSEVASHVGHLPSFQASNRRPRNGPTAHVFLHQAAVGGGDHQAAIVWRSRAERTRGSGRERATVMHVAQCAVPTVSFSLHRLKVIFLRILTRVPSGFFDVWLVSLHQPVFDNPALALGGVQLTLGIRCLGSRRLAKRERPVRVPHATARSMLASLILASRSTGRAWFSPARSAMAVEVRGPFINVPCLDGSGLHFVLGVPGAGAPFAPCGEESLSLSLSLQTSLHPGHIAE